MGHSQHPHPQKPSSSAGTPYPFRGLPPGSTCLKQRNVVIIRSDDLYYHREGLVTNIIHSIQAQINPKLTMCDSIVLDPDALSAIERSRDMRIWNTVQGETMDDKKTGGDHMSITVPTSTRSCQILILTHRDANEGHDMTGQECRVGYFEMDKETHDEIMNASKYHPHFSCEVDLTNLNLGPEPQGTRYSTREKMTREFMFEPGHAPVQPLDVDVSVNGFRATLPDFSETGYPNVEFQGEREWYGEVEMLVKPKTEGTRK